VSTHSERLERVATELVSRETENPPGNEAAAAEYIAGWFAERDIDADLVREPYPDRPQVAVRVGDGDPTVVLNGHIDVVPAGDRSAWTHEPYGADVVDGTLYGRGSADMKTGVAVAMLATADFASEFNGGDLDGSVVFHAAVGEETAEPGTKTLLESGYGGDYGVVLEPTGMRTATSEKGLAWYEITAAGSPSHASRPDQGDNAIANARPVLEALERYDGRVRERKNDLLGRAFATTTGIDAGFKQNVVPESATITVDRRMLPSEDVNDVDAEIDSLLAEVEADHDIRTEWERTRTYEAAEIPTDSPIAEVFREHSAAEGGVPTEPWGIEASTDVRNFVNDASIPAITWGPGPLDQAHTVDECIDLAEAATTLETLEAALADLFTREE
jgi:succinyl-diaminopimelate desuccinylase